MSTKVGFHDNSAAFMRSGDLSTRSRNPSDNAHNQTHHNVGLKVTGSPLGVKTGLKDPQVNTPLLPPMTNKAPSRTYAYQVSQLSLNEKQETESKAVKHDAKNVTGASKRANPKVVVNNTTKGAIHHSTSKDVLNDDMREVFSAGSKLA